MDSVTINLNPVTTKLASVRKAKVPQLNLEAVATKIKVAIKDKNDELYKLQVEVLHATWANKDPASAAQANKRCAVLEAEIAGLCEQLKTHRPNRPPSSATKRTQHQRTKQKPKPKQAATARPSRPQPKPQDLQKHAECMVRGLYEELSSGDCQKFIAWQEVQRKELAALEAQLAEAKAKGTGVAQIIVRLEACTADLKHVVTIAKEAKADVGAGVGVDSSDSESELDYEQVEELEIGDKVKLVCDDEDGFVRGDEGFVVEVDSTIAYPYRVQARKSRSVHGYFKACDLQLVQRKSPPVPSPCTPPPCEKVVQSPYERRDASPYKIHEADALSLDVDLEKGRCRISPLTISTVRKVAMTLNPLAVC